jgi:hypothetical protein
MPGGRRSRALALAFLLAVSGLTVLAWPASAHGNCAAGWNGGWGVTISGTNIKGTGYMTCTDSHADTYVLTSFTLVGSGVWRGDGTTHCSGTDYCEDDTTIHCNDGAGYYKIRVHSDVYNASGGLAHSDQVTSPQKWLSCNP